MAIAKQSGDIAMGVDKSLEAKSGEMGDVEVEAIWGEPLRRGRSAGVAMPELEGLYSRLKVLCPGS